MALPVANSPRSDDVAVLGWHALTVRIAWTLLSRGVKVRPEVLHEARDHVILHLDKQASVPHAEDQATALTLEFVDRARGRLPSETWSQDARMPLSPRWRRSLERSMDPTAEVVFRKHYGDNRSLAQLCVRLGVDELTLEAVRAGLREVVRRAARADGVPIDDWSDERVDHVLVRLAAYSPGPCPPLLDVVEGAHREHIASCTRCDRTVRLLRSSILTVEDLLPPSLGARPTSRARLLLLQVQPAARRHVPLLVAELGARSMVLADEFLLVDAENADSVSATIRLAAEVECPGRDLVRGVVVDGPGRWCKHGLIGPLVERARYELRSRQWGFVDGLGELPAPLPPPPSARGAWAATAAIVAAASLACWVALTPSAPSSGDLVARFTPARDGVWTVFDTAEEDLVSVVRAGPDGLEVVFSSRSPADKGALAVGDGSYRLHTLGNGVLVAAYPAEIAGLDRIVAQASSAADPLPTLARELASVAPSVDLELFSR